jgi:hypothetical protein
MASAAPCRRAGRGERDGRPPERLPPIPESRRIWTVGSRAHGLLELPIRPRTRTESPRDERHERHVEPVPQSRQGRRVLLCQRRAPALGPVGLGRCVAQHRRDSEGVPGGCDLTGRPESPPCLLRYRSPSDSDDGAMWCDPGSDQNSARDRPRYPLTQPPRISATGRRRAAIGGRDCYTDGRHRDPSPERVAEPYPLTGIGGARRTSEKARLPARSVRFCPNRNTLSEAPARRCEPLGVHGVSRYAGEIGEAGEVKSLGACRSGRRRWVDSAPPLFVAGEVERPQPAAGEPGTAADDDRGGDHGVRQRQVVDEPEVGDSVDDLAGPAGDAQPAHTV